MKELIYEEAINIYGDHMQYDKAFIMLKNNECKLYSVDDKNYIYVIDNIKYNMKEVKYNSSLKITNDLIEEIKNEINEFVVKVDDNMFNKYEVINEELNTENSYAYDMEDHSEQILIHKKVIHVK